MIQKIALIFILLLSFSLLLKAEGIDDIELKTGFKYTIKLNSGDILSGELLEVLENEEGEKSIKMQTEIGKATVFDWQISSIKEFKDHYRHSHRVYLLPTANPISENHYVGNFELGLLMFGVGISDYLSVTAGTTLLPYIESNQQAQVINAKVTLYEQEYPNQQGRVAFAIGTNYTFVNHDNKFVHHYAVASFAGERSELTTALFLKGGSKNYYEVKVKDQILDVNYADGAVGVAVGLDTKFSNWHDLHFIGELWNSDIMKPTNTGVLFGFRLTNRRFSADFGLALFTKPFAAPFVSFVWTPFN